MKLMHLSDLKGWSQDLPFLIPHLRDLRVSSQGDSSFLDRDCTFLGLFLKGVSQFSFAIISYCSGVPTCYLKALLSPSFAMQAVMVLCFGFQLKIMLITH